MMIQAAREAYTMIYYSMRIYALIIPLTTCLINLALRLISTMSDSSLFTDSGSISEKSPNSSLRCFRVSEGILFVGVFVETTFLLNGPFDCLILDGAPLFSSDAIIIES